MNRILLAGGTLIDGRRDAAPTKCDLLIEGDRVRRIGPAIRAPGARVLAAEGLIVAPGFIDSHSHSDLPALQDSSAQGRVYDGVTTEINGTCGFALFPLGGPSAAQRRAELAKKEVRADWRDAAGYFARVESFGSAINRGFLAGHGAIRSAVVGYAGRAATASQIRRMEALLDECLEQGALGFSSGLCYPPGCFAEPRELVALCRRLAAARRPYCTHMRSEGRRLLQSVRESLRVTAAAGAPLHISHLKTNGPANWWKIDRLERALFAARAAGRDVTCDRYPYLAAMTDLSAIFPDWLAAGGRERALDRLRSAASRAKLKKAVAGARTKGGRWDDDRDLRRDRIHARVRGADRRRGRAPHGPRTVRGGLRTAPAHENGRQRHLLRHVRGQPAPHPEVAVRVHGLRFLLAQPDRSDRRRQAASADIRHHGAVPRRVRAAPEAHAAAGGRRADHQPAGGAIPPGRPRRFARGRVCRHRRVRRAGRFAMSPPMTRRSVFRRACGTCS